jgi:hypothetical protein
MNRSETTNMSTEIQTIGGAILIQNAIKYAAYIAIAWLTLSFVDGWVMAWLS